jgi:hypothetical protein
LLSFFLRGGASARSVTDNLPTRIDPHAKPYVSWNVTHNTRTALSVHDSEHMSLVRSPFWCISLYDGLITSGENKLSVNWTSSAKLGGAFAVCSLQPLYQEGYGFDCMKMEFYLSIFHICVGNKQTEGKESLLRVAKS